LQTVLVRPDVRQRFDALNIQTRPLSPQALADFIRGEQQLWKPVIKEIAKAKEASRRVQPILAATTMTIDFQHHYTPPELMERSTGGDLRLDENGNPYYRFNALLADLPAHVRMMDHAGIDMAVLSCGSGFDQPDLATCRLINDRMRQAERDHPERFIGLAHVPALDARTAVAELRRCAVELGFPGVVIASELQGQQLDAESLRPFWRAAADLGLYVFIHPLPRVIRWTAMDADDLGACSAGNSR
jgi:predicted TIM-barrel fold metal-dependent hydrolase